MTRIAEIFESMAYGPAPESAATASAWLDDHQRRFGHFINGQWTLPDNAAYLAVMNPATGEQIAEVVDGDAATVDAAFSAASTALESWKATSDHERAKILDCTDARTPTDSSEHSLHQTHCTTHCARAITHTSLHATPTAPPGTPARGRDMSGREMRAMPRPARGPEHSFFAKACC